MSRRIQARIEDDCVEEFAGYITDEGITESEALRIAIRRLLAKKTKREEREAVRRKPGNPNFGKQSKDK